MDDSEIDIWASPTQDAPLAARPKTPKTPKTPTGEDAEPVSRDAQLRKELEGVRGVNESIEGLIETLKRADGDMTTVVKTVSSASSLLSTWTKILSQTEHNQRLVLHPTWQGVTEDLAEQEAEALERQQAAERRAAEEERRREEARRRREDDETARRLAPSSRGNRRPANGPRGPRTRGRVASRGATSSSRLPEPPSASSSNLRGGPSSGRGTGTSRSRYRTAR